MMPIVLLLGKSVIVAWSSLALSNATAARISATIEQHPKSIRNPSTRASVIT